MDFTTFFQNPAFLIWIWAWKTIIWWYPVLAVFLLAKVYMGYTRANFIRNLSWVLLEMKIPKEISKSPKAMEILFAQMHKTDPTSLIDIYIKGATRSWFSLELVSIEGEVHFYIRATKKFKKLIESAIYSQYPGVEVFEVEDYVHKVPYGVPGSDWNFWGTEFKLSKPDAFPIRTYVDYGLDEDPKEEFKIDPLSTVLEFLGSIGPGEQVWFQIPMMAARDRYHKPGTWFGTQGWKDEGKVEVKKISEGGKKSPDDPYGGVFKLTPGERERLEALEKSMTKYGFDCGYRGLYLAKGDAFDGTNIGRLINSVKQYGSENLNGFKLSFWTSFDYPWEDFMGWRVAKRKREMFRNYCRRSYFYPPAKSKVFVLNTEELATIFHFPGLTTSTPTLDRISSKRGEPPPNLPIG
jgi:hypothetical protein